MNCEIVKRSHCEIVKRRNELFRYQCKIKKRGTWNWLKYQPTDTHHVLIQELITHTTLRKVYPITKDWGIIRPGIKKNWSALQQVREMADGKRLK